MRKKAFTLLELMIVVAIIAILSALVLPNVIELTKEAKYRKAQETMKKIKEVCKLFYQDHSRFPTSINEINQYYIPPKSPFETDYFIENGYIKCTDSEGKTIAISINGKNLKSDLPPKKTLDNSLAFWKESVTTYTGKTSEVIFVIRANIGATNYTDIFFRFSGCYIATTSVTVGEDKKDVFIRKLSNQDIKLKGVNAPFEMEVLLKDVKSDSGFEVSVNTESNKYEFKMFYGPDLIFTRPIGANLSFSIFLNLTSIHDKY